LSPSTRDPHTADVLANELRNVVKLAEKTSGTPNPEVLLDKQVHGFRLVLTRTSSVESHQVNLSPRELEIARMIGKGLPNKMIADVLDISAWTVGTHLRRIFAKLSVPSRAAMIAKLLNQSAILSVFLSLSPCHGLEAAPGRFTAWDEFRSGSEMLASGTFGPNSNLHRFQPAARHRA
jgi:DNA-binding CsgD family transcriptional regulator